MIDINVDKAAERRYKALLRKAHTLRIKVSLLTLDGDFLKDLTPYFLDGQITVDATQSITRALEMTLIDPRGKISIEPDSPSRSSVFISDVVQVWYIIRNPQTDETFTVPVFRGPVDAVSTVGMFIDVKAVGKETLGLNNTWEAKTFKKGTQKTDVIQSILRNMLGETKYDIPDRPGKLSANLKVDRDTSPWLACTRLAASMNMQLFYDGRGVARMRPRKTKPVHTVDETWAAEVPEVAYDLTRVVNAVKVRGAKPKRAKQYVQYTAVAQRTHPLSPWRLGRGGVPRYIYARVEDDSLRTTAECKELAESMLEAGLMAGVTFTVDGIMDPRLEELDCVRASVGDVNVQAPIKSFVIPLTAGDDGAYGYIRRIQPKGGSKLIKRRKHKGQHKNHDKRNGTTTADGKGGKK